MIIDRLILENVGVYRGRNEIQLTPVSQAKPIVLFGGMNGGGKTTFLDSLHLGLYGRRARCSNRGSMPYKEYLRSLISRSADPAVGASIELTFRRTQAGEETSYTIRRSWLVGARDIDEQIVVLRNNEPDSVLSSTWDEFIESYIPSNIANLFFFDGEQIAELADPEASRSLLQTAIYTVLGLDLVDRLTSDLQVMERKKRVALKSDEEIERIGVLEREHRTAIERVEAAVQSCAHKSNEVDRAKIEADSCRATYKSAGGELFERLGDVESDKARLVAELADCRSALIDLAEGSAPLLLVSDLLEDLFARSQKEEETLQSKRALSVLEKRDKRILTGAERSAAFSKRALNELDQLLTSERKQQEERAGRRRPLDVPEGFSETLNNVLKTQLPGISIQARELVEQYRRTSELLARTNDLLAAVPHEDTVAELKGKLDAAVSRLAQLQAELQALETSAQVLSREEQGAAGALDRLFKERGDARIEAEETSRILRHSQRVRDTLVRFKESVVKKHADRLSDLIFESFSHLLRKASLISRIEVDAQTFEIRLYTARDVPVPINSLSAGERQLLATSMLWGLAKASGRPLPAVIDTPLGRLDSSHREQLVSRYFPVVSHQVILLSTDEEIHEKYLAKLAPFVGRDYQLSYDDATGGTQVLKGYFWKHASTT